VYRHASLSVHFHLCYIQFYECFYDRCGMLAVWVTMLCDVYSASEGPIKPLEEKLHEVVLRGE